MQARLGFFAAIFAAMVTFPAAARTPVHGKVASNAAAMRIGRSVGSPTTGHLIGGAHLDAAPYLRVVPFYSDGDVRWGLRPLVAMIDRAARQVRRKYPNAVLSVGHISRFGGGEVDRHASHESGRDADIGFYVKNHLGKPVLADRFVPFLGDGTAPTWPGAHFDDERNWLLITALVADSEARITHIFVAAPLRARLLAYGARIGTAPAIRNRAAELMVQPRGALAHDDHFHVRIACPAGMHECIEFPQRKQPLPRIAKAAPRAKPARTMPVAKPKVRPAPVVPRTMPRSEEPKEPAPEAPPPFEPPAGLLLSPAPIDDADGEL